MKRKIIFATTVFEDVSTGPGTFAQYIWEGFKEAEEFEFHLVAPNISVSHPRLHSFKIDSPRQVHRALCQTVDSVAQQLGSVGIIHTNNAHSMGSLVSDAFLLCQINDYEVATILQNKLNVIKLKGWRRFLALLWRYKEERKVCRRAKKLLCNSRYVLETVADEYHLPEEKLELVYKAVDLNIFEREMNSGIAREQSDPEKIKLLFVGSNWQIKGLDLLLEALTALRQEYSKLHLTVVGTETTEKNQRIRSAYKQLENEGLVKYVGRCDKPAIARLLHQSDIALLPSRQEGFGVSVLEALSTGTPVIASRVGGLPEILDEGRYGLLFEPENVEELTACLHNLCASRELRCYFADLGPERAELFSREAMLEKIRSLYLELLDE